MLKIWGRRSSFNLQKVMWLVGELGIEHEHVELGGQFGGLDTPEFLAMNPHGKVPVIEDGGVVAWESHAILRYLAARYGSDSLWSDDPGQRAPADGWMDWSQTILQPAFLMGVFWGHYRTPEPERKTAAVARNVARCAACFELLDRLIEDRPYLLGDELGLADIAIGTNLFRYFELDIERPQIPRVEAWYGRLRERPAFAEHVMVPFDDLFGRLDF